MSAKQSFEGADLSLDAPPRFDLGAVAEEPVLSRTSGESPLDDFEEDPNNPRTEYVNEQFDQLVNSVRKVGVIVPVTVVKLSTGRLRLVTGHRRFRAAKAVGLSSLKWALAGNAQADLTAQFHENYIRADIEPMDKAKKIAEMVESGITRREIAAILGTDASAVTHLMALTKLPSFLQSVYDAGKCRNPKYLYDLRRLYEANPGIVERHCAELELVDHKVLQDITALTAAASDRSLDKKPSESKARVSSESGQKKRTGKFDGLAVSKSRLSFKGAPVRVLRVIAELEDGKECELKGADLAKLLWAAADN